MQVGHWVRRTVSVLAVLFHRHGPRLDRRHAALATRVNGSIGAPRTSGSLSHQADQFPSPTTRMPVTSPVLERRFTASAMAATNCSRGTVTVTNRARSGSGAPEAVIVI